MSRGIYFFCLIILFSLGSLAQQNIMQQDNKETAIFGGGCFWCTEAIFQQIKGVDSVVSGYAGGEIPNPTYKMVSAGNSGYIEVVRVYYDNKLIDYRDLVEIFFGTHDPTSIDRQGHDVGYQYKSVIFYQNEKQEEQAKEQKKLLQRYYKQPIVTKILPFKNFYKAEEDHQDFYANNEMYPYCKIVIKPKIDKLLQNFYPFVDWK